MDMLKGLKFMVDHGASISEIRAVFPGLPREQTTYCFVRSGEVITINLNDKQEKLELETKRDGRVLRPHEESGWDWES
ncbi:hypothetical protein IFR05_008701 [Cadophora sp. M221]|nr:hypothetical protein IFR05_008701 [Cadophora sp. M221]